MKNKTIGVIGRGFVGGAVENGFKDYEIKAFDVSKDRQKDIEYFGYKFGE